MAAQSKHKSDISEKNNNQAFFYPIGDFFTFRLFIKKKLWLTPAAVIAIPSLINITRSARKTTLPQTIHKLLPSQTLPTLTLLDCPFVPSNQPSHSLVARLFPLTSPHTPWLPVCSLQPAQHSLVALLFSLIRPHTP